MIGFACLLVMLPVAVPVEAQAVMDRRAADRAEAREKIAAPVTVQCSIKGKSISNFGRRLAVTVDIDALMVEIETVGDMRGWHWRYRNGQTAAILVGFPPGMVWQPGLPATTPVSQFVQVTPQSITVGWYTPEGEPGQVSSFNRSALDRHPAPCVWRSATDFDLSEVMSALRRLADVPPLGANLGQGPEREVA